MKVSELLVLKIENYNLKLQQLQHMADKFVAELNVVIEKARVEVGASPSAKYNQATQEFEE